MLLNDGFTIDESEVLLEDSESGLQLWGSRKSSQSSCSLNSNTNLTSHPCAGGWEKSICLILAIRRSYSWSRGRGLGLAGCVAGEGVHNYVPI